MTQYRTIAIPCVLVWFSRGVGTTSVSFQDDKQLALVSLHPIYKSTRRLVGAVRGVTSGVISGLQCKKETLKCFTRLRVKQTHTCCKIVPQEGVAAYKHFKQAWDKQQLIIKLYSSKAGGACYFVMLRIKHCIGQCNEVPVYSFFMFNRLNRQK